MMEFREILKSHLDLYRPDDDLRLARPLAPLPAQERIIRSAVADARRWGKRLPAELKIWTVGRPRESRLPTGATLYHRDTGLIEVYLDVDAVTPDALAKTTYHEMSHVDDFLRGDFDQLPGEERALDFAAWAMARWR